MAVTFTTSSKLF